MSNRKLEELMHQLAIQESHQPAQGPISAEVLLQTLHDLGSGSTHVIGGAIQSLVIGEDGVPYTIQEMRKVVASCGHLIDINQQGLSMCSYGHILCPQHQLYRCAYCGDLICEIEMKKDEDGDPMCPDHGSFWRMLNCKG